MTMMNEDGEEEVGRNNILTPIIENEDSIKHEIMQFKQHTAGMCNRS